MKKTFKFEFEDLSSSGAITYDCSNEGEEKFTVSIENGMPVIYANREAFLLLSKICAIFALSDYDSGFHVHLPHDFDEEQTESIRLVLNVD